MDFTNPPAMAILPGTYTVAGLPSPALYQGKYAFVTNLGGGADMVLSDGSFWKHIRPGVRSVITPVSGSPSLSITPLITPPTMAIVGTLNFAMALNVLPANLYPGYSFTIIRPTAIDLLGSLVLQLNAGLAFTLLGSSWYDFQYDGTQLRVLRSNNLLAL